MKYSIIKADIKKDRDDIVALWSRNFPGVTEERYNWMYENNPSGQALCWLANTSEHDSAIASSALFPRGFLVNGRHIMACVSGDSSVDKEYRGLGLALELYKTKITEWCKESRSNIVYSVPKKSAEFIFKKAGYSTVGSISRLTKALSIHYYFKRYIDIPIITKIMSKFIDFGLRFFSKEKFYRINSEYNYEILSFFDERFDIFWGKISTKFPIIGERNRAFLNWKYSDAPHKHYYAFALTLNQNRDIAGYIVFTKNKNRVMIDDFLCIDMDETFNFLLSLFINYQRNERANSISVNFAGTRAFIKKFKEFGFSIRDDENKLILCVYSFDEELLQYLLDIEKWYFLLGDNDI